MYSYVYGRVRGGQQEGCGPPLAPTPNQRIGIKIEANANLYVVGIATY